MTRPRSSPTLARGSALECAACLDVLVARSRLASGVADQGKATLVRVVSTITKLIERHLHDAATSTRRTGACPASLHRQRFTPHKTAELEARMQSRSRAAESAVRQTMQQE